MTIRYQTGNLLDASAEPLVNAVNEVGVVGKGITLQLQGIRSTGRRRKAAT